MIFDNNCGAWTQLTASVLKDYVLAGLVEHNTQFSCLEMKTFMFMHGFRGGSAMARQLSGMRGVPKGALVVSIDDDEFVVLSNVSRDLGDLAIELYQKKVCAVQLLWKVSCPPER